MLTKGSTVLSTKEPKPESGKQWGLCQRSQGVNRMDVRVPAKYSDGRVHLDDKDLASCKGKNVAQGGNGGDEEEEPTAADRFLGG